MDISKYNKKIEQRLVQLLDIPKDIVYDLPKMTIIGNIQLYIENHRGIIEYRQERVRIAATIGEIEVLGQKLVIRNINRDEIYLDGTIGSIAWKH